VIAPQVLLIVDARSLVALTAQSHFGETLPDLKETISIWTNWNLMGPANVNWTSGVMPIMEVLLSTLLMVVEMVTVTQVIFGTKELDHGELTVNSKKDAKNSVFFSIFLFTSIFNLIRQWRIFFESCLQESMLFDFIWTLNECPYWILT